MSSAFSTTDSPMPDALWRMPSVCWNGDGICTTSHWKWVCALTKKECLLHVFYTTLSSLCPHYLTLWRLWKKYDQVCVMHHIGCRPTSNAMRIRDKFSQHFSQAGAPPWQNDAISRGTHPSWIPETAFLPWIKLTVWGLLCFGVWLKRIQQIFFRVSLLTPGHCDSPVSVKRPWICRIIIEEKKW